MAITRRLEDAGALLQALQALGATAHVLPCIATRALPLARLPATTLHEVGRATHVGFASGEAARALAAMLAARGGALGPTTKLVAVGAATASEIERLWPQQESAVTTAKPYSAEGLAACLVAMTRGRRAHVLLPTAVGGRTVVAESLAAAGVVVTRLPVYETISLDVWHDMPAVPPKLDYVLFTSPSTVAGWARSRPNNVSHRHISLGPATSTALRAHGLHVHGEAAVHSLEGLLAALLRVHHGR